MFGDSASNYPDQVKLVVGSVWKQLIDLTPSMVKILTADELVVFRLGVGFPTEFVLNIYNNFFYYI